MKNVVSKTLTVVPAVLIFSLGLLLLILPSESYDIISVLRYIVGDKLSSYYLMLGLVFIIILLYISLTKYGEIKLGLGNPEYSNFQWGSMIFTSTMAADIVFFSFHEWSYYYNANPHGIESVTAYDHQLWSSSYPLFHWGPTPWVFYILPALAYAYLMHNKKVTVYRISHACAIRSNPLRNCIDIFAIVALIVATSTTFSLATPLMTEALCSVLGLGHATATTTIIVLCIVATVYTAAVLFDLKGINKLASWCVYLFAVLLFMIVLNSDLQYIVETGLTSIGYVFQNFLTLSTDTGSLRLVHESGNTFVQDWTVFYWAYWISWSIATPFFIARISKGRTIKQTALGAMVAGLLGTFTSFIILGNYGLNAQMSGKYDMVEAISNSTPAESIVELIRSTVATPNVVLILLFISMVSFYASTFDALTLVVSQYVCKEYREHPPKLLKLVWSILLIVFPIALIFTESTLYSLQALNIIFAFPVSIVLIRVVYVFLKLLRNRIYTNF